MTHPMKTTRALLAAAMTVTLVAPTARAQIDKRVNTGNGNSGRLHDSNPGVGSGGMNLARPTYDFGGRSDAIITGNVSGLGRFQGNSPLMQNNAFRASLGSTALSDFQRQSVGLQDVLNNQTIAPGYYYDTQRTISDISDIRRGLNQPGSSTLTAPGVAPLRGGGLSESRLDLGLRDTIDRRVAAGGPPGASYGSIPNPSPMSIAPLYFDQAAGSSIFGPPRNQPSVLEQLAERRAARRALLDRSANDLQRTRLESELARRDTGIAAPAPLSPPPPPEAMPPSIASIRITGDESTTNRPVSPGADRFAEMMGAIQAAQDAGQPIVGFRARGAAGANEDKSDRPKGTATDSSDTPTGLNTRGERGRRSAGLTDKSTEAAKSVAAAAKWAGASLDDPISSFVGANADQFNQFMGEGEEALRAGRYFDAAREFDMASVIDSRNPLPLLARGHALAAAGNYISAVNSLTRGIAQFPQITVFRLDLPAMVGQSDVFDRRRAELERRLSTREDRELRFLLGYLELYSGLPDSAQKNLLLAAKASPDGSVIAKFPDLVFGGAVVPVVKP